MTKPFNYGGQAVIEGVMMRGKEGVAVSVRLPDGTLATERRTLPSIYKGRLKETPLIRGIIVLIETLVMGTQVLLNSAELASSQEEEEIPKGVLWGTVAGSLAFGIALFFVGPLFLTRYIIDPYISSNLTSNLIEGFIRIGIFLAYLKIIGLLPDIKRVFAYHGAEHKTVNAYEAGSPLQVESVRKYSTAHPRCGTSFGFIVLIVAIFVFALSGRPSIWISVLSRIVLIPVIAAISYEIMKFGASHIDNKVVRITLSPGLLLQSMTTREPDDGQVEVAIAALKEVIEIDRAMDSDYNPKKVVGVKEVPMFTLSSPEIVEQGIIPAQYTMDNPNQVGISPPLNWSDTPQGTKSFALALVDPDVPLEEEWFPYKDMLKVGMWPGDLCVHWMAYNIPASAMGLSEGSLPAGASELTNGMGSPGYLGMGPPQGHKAHKYIFTLYALDVDVIELTSEAGYVDFTNAMKGKVLATASLTGYFGH